MWVYYTKKFDEMEDIDKWLNQWNDKTKPLSETGEVKIEGYLFVKEANQMLIIIKHWE